MFWAAWGGCSGQGQTDRGILEARPDSAPETGGLRGVQAHWGSTSLNKGPNDLV